jgi:hypothetical protein
MICGDFSAVVVKEKPIQAAAARFLIGRSRSSPAEDPFAAELGAVKGQRVICDNSFHRTIDPPIKSAVINENQCRPRMPEIKTASMRRPAPIRFLANLPRTPQKQKQSGQLKIGTIGKITKCIQENRERFAKRNEVVNEKGEVVKVDEVWLESFLTPF